MPCVQRAAERAGRPPCGSRARLGCRCRVCSASRALWKARRVARGRSSSSAGSSPPGGRRARRAPSATSSSSSLDESRAASLPALLAPPKPFALMAGQEARSCSTVLRAGSCCVGSRRRCSGHSTAGTWLPDHRPPLEGCLCSRRCHCSSTLEEMWQTSPTSTVARQIECKGCLSAAAARCSPKALLSLDALNCRQCIPSPGTRVSRSCASRSCRGHAGGRLWAPVTGLAGGQAAPLPSR